MPKSKPDTPARARTPKPRSPKKPKKKLADIRFNDHAHLTWLARSEAHHNEDGDNVRPVAEVINTRLDLLMDDLNETDAKFRDGETRRNIGVMWTYLSAGGLAKPLGGENPELVEEAVERMHSANWWGNDKTRFQIDKDKVTHDFMKDLVRKSSSHNADATIWVRMVRKLYESLQAEREKMRDSQEKKQLEMERQVQDHEGRLVQLEAERANKNAKVRALEIYPRGPSTSFEKYDPPVVPSSEAPKPEESQPLCAAVVGFNGTQYDALFKGRKGPDHKRLDIGDKRLDRDQIEAHRLLQLKYKRINYDKLSGDVRLHWLEVGHHHRRVARWIAERRICKANIEHTADYESLFNHDHEDDEYECLAGYRKSGDTWHLAGALLVQKVLFGYLIEFLAAVHETGLGSVLTLRLVAYAEGQKAPIVYCYSLSSSSLDMKRIKLTEEELQEAKARSETCSFWMDRMTFGGVTKDNVKTEYAKLKRLSHVIPQNHEVKTVEQFFRVLAIEPPKDDQCFLYKITGN